jgi:hypothetical protein
MQIIRTNSRLLKTWTSLCYHAAGMPFITFALKERFIKIFLFSAESIKKLKVYICMMDSAINN